MLLIELSSALDGFQQVKRRAKHDLGFVELVECRG